MSSYCLARVPCLSLSHAHTHTYAPHTLFQATLINVRSVMDMPSRHGNYSWVTDFFRFDYANPNLTVEHVLELHPNVTVIEHVDQVRTGACPHTMYTAVKAPLIRTFTRA